MAAAESFEIAKAVVTIDPTSSFETVLRVIAKHFTAAADELAQIHQSEIRLNFSGSNPTPGQVEDFKRQFGQAMSQQKRHA